jgi:hypothetical protein
MSNTKPIRAILDIINSKQDRAGNCYWAFRYTRTSDGRQAIGKISGGESNIYTAVWQKLHNGGHDFHYTRHEYDKRRFDAETSGWIYAGCSPEDIAASITAQLSKPEQVQP